MGILILRIRNGGFFIGPKHWLVDHGTHYDFHLAFVRRRIFKNSIDSFYELSAWYATLLLPFLLMAFLALYFLWVIWKLTIKTTMAFLRF